MWLVLEDNPGRTAAFAKAAEGCSGADSIRIWRTSAQMIHDLPGLLARLVEPEIAG